MTGMGFSALIPLLFSAATLVSSLTTDGLSLLALKSAISLDPTRILGSWSDSDPDPCLWAGVTCRQGRVTALSLSSCSLYGYLPSELSLLSSLQTLNLPNNRFFGPLPTAIGALGNLTALDLSNNNLTGSIPSEIGNLTALAHLDFSSNFLSGLLPPAIAGISTLSSVLNLSFNRFSGRIPPEFGKIPVAVSLDLRQNNLSGEIPQVGSLLNQGPTAFAGNPNLCGFPLKTPCSSPLTPKSSLPLTNPSSAIERPVEPEEKRRTGPAVTIPILVGIVLAALVSILVLQWQFRRRKGLEEGKRGKEKKGGELAVEGEQRREGRSGEIYAAIDEGFGLELEELLRASAYVVGKSKSGIVYKVVVGRGSAVAVRRLSEAEDGENDGDEWRRRRAFESEALAIGRAKHPNVVSLRAYYFAPDEKLLIYDYIPSGTLRSALHGTALNPTAQRLPWASRLTIIQGAARGLAYLHECSPRKYVHGNVKSCKILLDDDLHAYISGFGLPRLLSVTRKSTHSISLSKKPGSTTLGVAGPAAEYLAPEARVPGTPVTQKCDVYAFGVVLLEVLTGRLPGARAEDGHVEVEAFVRSAFKEERPLSEVVDPALLPEVHAKNQVLSVFHVALSCTDSDPDLRPRMRVVSEGLDRIGSTHEGSVCIL